MVSYEIPRRQLELGMIYDLRGAYDVARNRLEQALGHLTLS
jgi:hypothetical protein